jgi:hypothetical protein
MKIDNLIVTQNSVRATDNISLMTKHVENGGFWDKQSLERYSKENGIKTCPLIQISQFEDGRRFIHDGHHRTIATVLGKRDYLREDEFEVTLWKYSDYTVLSPENGWFTPFDPRTHVRLGDFLDYKKLARDAYARKLLSEDWVKEIEYLFKGKREFLSVDELINRLGLFV